MNKVYIFDVDYTLYSQSEISDLILTKEFYESFKKKPYLKKLLNQLNGDKYIFTNGNFSHMDYVLKHMDLVNIFEDYVCSDELKHLKPYKSAYKYVTDKFKLKNHTQDIYFFEDTIDNLKMAKEFGWKTILIYDGNISYKNTGFIDHIFKSVEDAIMFFINVNK